MTIDLESWQLIAAAVAAVVVSVYSKWEAWKTRKTAEKAVELSKPTGNGFANEVKQSLARIEERQQRSDQVLFDHITSHANADVMKGARNESPPN